MTPTRLVIATTEAPAEILYLGREDAAIGRSTVCLDGTTAQAGIDTDYNAFVRQPTGVIERLYGHAAFRMDVSAPIDVGSSWQLGALIAHALEAEGALVQRLDGDTPARRLVWATGAIRAVDLAVGEVGHVPQKLQRALQLFAEARAEGLPVIAVMPEGNLAELPADLRARLDALGVSLCPVAGVEAALKALDLALPRPAAAADKVQRRLDGAPWPGLAAYGIKQHDRFFGRARVREEALERLRRAAAQGCGFLLVHGRSGVGKSSLARAGIAADVVAQAREGGQWRVADLVLDSTAPLPALALALRDIAPSEALQRDVVGAVTAGLAKDESLLLVVDQLEQLFQHEDTAAQGAFAAVLAALCASGRVWVVATMRGDTLALLDSIPALARLASDARLFRLGPPTLFEITEMILAPAALAGLRFAAAPDGRDLPAALAEPALRSPDSLPLLQVVLTRLAALAEPDGTIPFAAYERIGGFQQAVGRYAEDTHAALLADGIAPDRIDRVLAGLVRFDVETGRGLARLLPADQADDPARRILDRLVAARLVRTAAAGEVPGWRLAHEVILTDWPRLAALIEAMRQDLVLRDRIEAVAEDWAAAGRRPDDLLLAEARLDAAEDLAARALVEMPPEAARYLTASRAELIDRSRKATARRRLALGMGIAAATLIAVAAGIAVWQRGERLASAATAASRAARLSVDSATALTENGFVDEALLRLIAASDALPAGPEPALETALREALDRATRETRFAIPAGAEPFKANGVLYYMVPASGAVFRFDGTGAPKQVFTLPGRLAGSGATGPFGGVVAVRMLNSERQQEIAFFSVKDDNPRLLWHGAFGDATERPDITITWDGFGDVRQPITDPTPSGEAALIVNLRSGAAVSDRTNWLGQLMLNADGYSFAADADTAAQAELRQIGIAPPPADTSDAPARTCLWPALGAERANALSPRMAALGLGYGNGYAYSASCARDGTGLVLSLDVASSGGGRREVFLTDPAYLPDPADMPDYFTGNADNPPFLVSARSDLPPDGASLTNGQGVVVASDFRDVTLALTDGATPLRSLSFTVPAPVELQVALPNGQTALVLKPGVGRGDTSKTLLMVDPRRVYGTLPTSPLNAAPLSTQLCLVQGQPAENRQPVDLTTIWDEKETVEGTMRRVNFTWKGQPQSLLVPLDTVETHACLTLSPELGYYAVSDDTGLRVLDAKGHAIGSLPGNWPQATFRVPGSPEMFVAERSDTLLSWNPADDRPPSALLTLRYPITQVATDRAGRLFVVEDIGESELIAQAYDAATGLKLADLGSGYKFLTPVPLDDGSLLLTAANDPQQRFAFDDRATLVADARHWLSQACRIDPDQPATASACWRDQGS
ncbi:MAG: hypothetical protein GC146_12130 [Limimaricola sp.]|uniref:nSTAND1 domain-containing NTPase n=1 Tax=Limimaricola sp. TaxID=2211665 RepID=UPI001D9CD3D1|nr:ATP-binding protein [Limimaricola sp.]MBI1417962.1 hypothetical protein [Limimaricola sp.]